MSAEMNTTTKKAANSIVGKLTAGILAVAARTRLPSASAQQGGGPVLVIGDSIQTGLALPRAGARRRNGRVRLPKRPLERGGSSGCGGCRVGPEHAVVVFDLGTNDDPRNPEALYRNLSALHAVSPASAAWWSPRSCPNYGGVGPQGLSAAVERFAAEDGNAQAADWYGAATGTPASCTRTATTRGRRGYALRAILADAIAACSGSGSGGGDLSSIPAPSGKQRRPPRPLEPLPPLEVPRPELPHPRAACSAGRGRPERG